MTDVLSQSSPEHLTGCGSGDRCLSLPPFDIYRNFRYLCIVLAVITIVRIVYLAAGVIELSGDEAHYWEWSRHLDLCYYSKPPLVAVFIRLGTLLFGHTVLGVRFFAPLLSVASSLLLYVLAERLYDPRTAFYSALLLQIVPLFSAFGIGMTPDTLLIFFWILSLLLVRRALETDRLASWFLLGIALGLGLLAKYIIVAFHLCAALHILTSPELRKRLKVRGPVLALVTSLLFFAPVIIWNSNHHWVMFRHDLAHAAMNGKNTFDLLSAPEFIGSQLLAITPLLLVMALYAVVSDSRHRFCFWFSVPILAVFLLKSLHAPVQGNWPLAAHITLLVVFAHRFLSTPLTPRLRHLTRAAVLTSLVATIGLYGFFLLPTSILPRRINPAVSKIAGFKQLGREVARMVDEQTELVFVIADHYMLASELAFYIPGHPTTYCLNAGRRMNQYDLWPGFETLSGYTALYVTTYPDMPADFKAAFDSHNVTTISIRDKADRCLKRYNVFTCHNFKGMPRRSPDSF